MLCAALTAGHAALAQTTLRFGDAASFVVLGSGSVTNSGATQVTGNLGISPGNTVNGLSSSNFLLGAVRRDDALARAARSDGNRIDDELAGTRCNVTLPDAQLGGKRLSPGVYCFPSADIALSGTLILDAEGNRDAVWIFRITGTLATAPDASVLVVGNGYGGNVFWRTGDTATIGARMSFIGNLFAAGSIVFQDRASLSGRAISRRGSVSLTANRLSLCCAPIAVTPATVPISTLGTVYRQTFAVDGGIAPYTFAITSGSLPFGLALDANGVLQGTSEQTGVFAFTVTATDQVGCSASAAYTIEIACGTRTILPAAAIGARYRPASLFDGTACNVTSGALPPGMFAGCALTGTPTTKGTFTFVIESGRRSRCFTIDVGDCRLHITPATLPNGRVGVAYPAIDFTVDGGTPPFRFTITTGALPPGLALSGDTLSGTPNTFGTYAFGLRISDRNGCRDTVRFCAIDIAPGTCPGIGILALAPDDLPPATPAKPYAVAMTPSGGTAPYTLMLSEGTLPAGLELIPTGIAGVTAETGAFPLTITATDSSGCRVSRCYTLLVGTAVPTLSQWALLLIAVLLAVAGWFVVGRT